MSAASMSLQFIKVSYWFQSHVIVKQSTTMENEEVKLDFKVNET